MEIVLWKDKERSRKWYSAKVSSRVGPEENAYLKAEMRGLSSDSAGKVLVKKTKGLSTSPSIHKKEEKAVQGMDMCVLWSCNPEARGTETGGSLELTGWPA